MRISKVASYLGVSRIVSVLGILALCCLGELATARETIGSPVTDASGAYSAQVIYGSAITVTPTHSDNNFNPAFNIYSNVTTNVTDQNYAGSLITTAERQALISLYTSTNGDSWTDETGWKTPPLDPDGFALPGTEAGWYGLTIDSDTQQVTRINMPNNNLTGSLPTEVGNLTGLTWLYLDNNQLGGSIPASLGNLTALQELHLYHNQLTGPIPAEIGNLTNLYFIDLGNNQLSGSIPMEIGNLTELYKLCLNDNQLSGPIPAELGSLSNLGYLYLNTNELSGSIPLELCSLPNLRHLILWANKLSGSIPPELGNLISLPWIVLRYNQLTGEIPAELGNLANLQVLRLGDNQLSGKIPAELGNLTNLQSLRLSHNQLSGEMPDTLGNLTQLWEMLINSNQLTGPIPTSLASLTALTTTDLGYNALYTSNEALNTFLNMKDADWAATQTIAPTGITATSLDNAVIMVSPRGVGEGSEMGTPTAAVLAVVILAGCAASPSPSPPEPAAPTPMLEVAAGDPPAGRAVRLDDVAISADRMTLALEFTGGPVLPPDDPCATDYSAWVRRNVDALDVGVVELQRVPGFQLPLVGGPVRVCAAVGARRRLDVALARPFRGVRIQDLAGQVLFVGSPPGLAVVRGMPPGWRLAAEQDVPESPGGRWQRTYSNRATLPPSGDSGRLELFQAFGSAAGVSGGEEVRDIKVNGVPATLFRSPDVGELVLVWSVDGDGLALVASEVDFSIAQLVALAESVVIVG